METYIKEYCGDFQFDFVEHISLKIADISVDIDVYEAEKKIDGIMNHREKANVRFQKGSVKYECEFFEEHGYPNCFFEVHLRGRLYICFRKTLYGFTLLDAQTLTEVYEYVPKAMLKGEESFIITDVKQLDELLILEGCYWAYPYECFAFDMDEKRFFNVSEILNMDSLEEVKVNGNQLILTDIDEETKEITKEDIVNLICKNGCAEI